MKKLIVAGILGVIALAWTAAPSSACFSPKSQCTVVSGGAGELLIERPAGIWGVDGAAIVIDGDTNAVWGNGNTGYPGIVVTVPEPQP